MTRRAIYDPPPAFGLSFLKIAAVEVEVLDGKPVAAPGMVWIRHIVPKNALINVLAKIPEAERKETTAERLVPAEHLTMLDDPPPAPARAPHRWSGWPGAWCLDCGIEDPREVCMATNPECSCVLMDESKTCSVQVHPCPSPNEGRHDPYRDNS